MRRILILAFFACLICPSICFGRNRVRQDNNFQSNFAFSKTVDNEFPNIYRSIGDLFRRIFGKKGKVIACVHANVENLTLSQTEVTASCSSKNNSCSEKANLIEITTEVKSFDSDDLLYSYSKYRTKIVKSCVCNAEATKL